MVIRTLIFVSMIGLLSSCSIQWRDSDGIDHHLGLVAQRTTQLTRGVRTERTSMGLDLRLSGHDTGVSLGIKQINQVTPEMIAVDNPDELADLVYEYYNTVGSSKNPSNSLPNVLEDRWSFFYFKDEVSRNATLLKSISLGAELRTGPVRSGGSLLFCQSEIVLGMDLQNGIVQVYTPALTDVLQKEELVLWYLVPPRIDPSVRTPPSRSVGLLADEELAAR